MLSLLPGDGPHTMTKQDTQADRPVRAQDDGGMPMTMCWCDSGRGGFYPDGRMAWKHHLHAPDAEERPCPREPVPRAEVW